MARYVYTQESGATFKVNPNDKADATEDTCEVRQILHDLGNLLGHSKYDDSYPADLTTGGDIDIRRVTSKTTTATLTAAESGLIKVTAASAWTLGLPAASSALEGLIYYIVKTDNNTNIITIDGNNSETINGETTYEGLNEQWMWVIIKCDSSNWIILADSRPAEDLLVNVKEKNEAPIIRGQAAYVSGAAGANTLVAIADNTDSAKIRVLGLAYADIAQNGQGHVVIHGIIHNVDTRKDIGGINDESGVNWSAGDLLYINSNGLLTSTRPTSGRVIQAGFSLEGSGVNDDLLITIHVNAVDLAATAGEDLRMRLGADDGSTDIHIKNYSDVLVASINDKGVGQFKTTVTTFSSVDTLAITEAGQVLVSAGSPYTLTLPTPVGYMGLTYKIKKTDFNYNLITIATTAGQFNYENADSALKSTYLRLNTGGAEATIVSDGTNWQVINEAMGQVPECRVYLGANQLDLVHGSWTLVEYDTESYDIGSNFNTTTHIFTVPIPGKYFIGGSLGWYSNTVVANKPYGFLWKKDGANQQASWAHSSDNDWITNVLSDIQSLVAADEVSAYAVSNADVDTVDIAGSQNYPFIIKLVSKD